MGKSNNLTVLLALLAITAAVVPSIEAADHVVGDSSGWIVPGNSSFYSEWAAKQTLAVGDNLVFNFVTGAHTVARTTKAGYDSCDLNAATNTISTAPAEVTLDAAGDYYFICTVPGHCAVGQKLAVTVGASSSGVPSPAPSGSSAPPPSEAPSAATPEASPPPSEAPSASTPEASSSPSGSAIPTPEASPSPAGSMNPMAEPPSSSASSLVATLSLGLMSATVALFY